MRDGAIRFGDGGVKCDQTFDITGKYVVPGFVDIHFHGYNLFEFTAGRFDPVTNKFDNSEETYQEGFAMLARELARQGTTGVYLSTWAAPVAAIRRALDLLAKYMRDARQGDGARLLGSFIEGSFISPAMTGAQDSAGILEASVESYRKLAVPDVVKLVNVAPERGEAAMELIRVLASEGVVVGCGHTAATADQINAAVKAGLKYFVHFLNGPTGHNYKPFDGGGAVEAVLTSDEIYAEQICDGVHIDPAYVRGVIARKGLDRVIGVTDALYIAGSEVREFLLGNIAGRVSDDGRCAYVVGKANTLCSSLLTMDRAFANLLNWLSSDVPGIWTRMHEKFSFEESLAAAVKFCSTNPNRLVGRKDFGIIADGAAADMCVLDIKGKSGNYTTTVAMTVVDGNVVYSKN
jgi:N-acetylglucosamine-6-phosphate deacetylase